MRLLSRQACYDVGSVLYQILLPAGDLGWVNPVLNSAVSSFSPCLFLHNIYK